jgi:hypothetical protein
VPGGDRRPATAAHAQPSSKTINPLCEELCVNRRSLSPLTTMLYERARHNLDRHPNSILAAYMASDI